MSGLVKRTWRALTVPTFKMRIGQTFVVVVCIVASLILVGSILIVNSGKARKLSEQAGGMYEAAEDLEATAEKQEAALVAFEGGDVAAANAALEESRRSANEALAGLSGVGTDEASSLEERARALGEQAPFDRPPGSYTPEELAALESDAGARVSATAGLVSDIKAGASELIDESVAQGRGNVRFGVIAFTVILIATALLGALTMSVAYRGLSGIVKRVTSEVNEIARGKGDLTARVNVPTRDVFGDLGDAINAMVSSLRGSMLEIRSVSETLTASAQALASSIEGMSASTQEVSSASEQISTGSEDQAHKVEMTSSAIGNVARSMESISERAELSSRQSGLTASLAEEGSGAADEAVRVMRDIYDSVQNSGRLMEGLGERFRQIGIIIDVITDIADQTNLLALNAAIEAARAGEHGKGFSVVAGEVRKLAENSRKSAEEISHLIREIMSETGKVTASMGEGTERVESGRQVAEHTGEALSGILDASRTAAGAAEEISNAIQDIAGSTDQVYDSISDIAAIAEETAASTEEVAATLAEQRMTTDEVAGASLGLAQLASKLRQLTEGFKL